MAYGFHTTDGTANSDIIESVGNHVITDTCSMWVWTYRTGSGSNQRLIASETTTPDVVEGFYVDTSNQPGFNRDWSGASANWGTSTAITANTWEGMGVSYDGSSTSNDPIFYINGTKNAAPSEFTAPSGTIQTESTAQISVGGVITAQTLAFKGRLAHAAVWNVVLNDAEFAALQAGYSPLLIRPNALTSYNPLIRDSINVIKGGADSVTGAIAGYDNPPVIYPEQQELFVPAAAAATVPPLSYHHRFHNLAD